MDRVAAVSSTYLTIAEVVLRRVRRPLTPLQILRTAYEFGIAPPQLRGRTQGKTMGARLSEDVLRLRDESRFYRTAPGRFLLRDLMDDPGIPADLRRPIIARRRRRSLAGNQALALRREAVLGCAGVTSTAVPDRLLSREPVLHMIQSGEFHYAPTRSRRGDGDVLVWSFVLVVRDGAVLTYRQGPYRDDRNTFMRRRTIGFYTPVLAGDLGLFDQADHGIVTSGVRSLAMDLDLLDRQLWDTLASGAELRSFVFADAQITGGATDFSVGADLLAVVVFSCPEWLDPTTKRLAINDIEWLNLQLPRNHEEDFDPWSRAVL
jgi:hypothetical protein